MKRFVGTLSLLAAGAALFSIAGCPTQQTGGNTNVIPSSLSDLTSGELAAIATLIDSPGALGLGTNVLSNGPSNDEALQTSLNAGDSFGTCPVVSFTATQGDALTLGLSIDFGTGCTPTGSTAVCSGEAAGTYTLVSNTIDASFANLGCDGNTLTGDAVVTASVDSSGVELNGSWTLGFNHDNVENTTGGYGTSIYDAQNARTSIPTFIGTLTEGAETYSATLSDVELSYDTYGNFIPYAGEGTVSNADLRSITVRFNENSPSTGDVEISVDGSPFFDANLNNL